VNRKLRDLFDMQLEDVLAGLPKRITKLLDEVPLHVEDYPSREIMEMMGIADRGALCGLYSGVPLTERSVVDVARLPDYIAIYREGIVHRAAAIQGRLTEDELRRQIRITVLHEIGHYHGLDEDDLEELGYG